jgi:hypothetical protein
MIFGHSFLYIMCLETKKTTVGTIYRRDATYLTPIFSFQHHNHLVEIKPTYTQIKTYKV